MEYDDLKLLVQKILQGRSAYDWSVQGLGMLRMYLSDYLRLHVWDRRLRAPGVSAIHSHPWAFQSSVVVGEIQNVRYIEEPVRDYGDFYYRSKILCGPGGGLLDSPERVSLALHSVGVIRGGQAYSQEAADIHESRPSDGTVTLCFRKLDLCHNKDHASVFWPAGEQFGSAEPRSATREEANDVITRSLVRWFR